MGRWPVPIRKFVTLSSVLLLGLAGCQSQPAAPVPECPRPAPLPAWVIKASEQSSTPLLDQLISPYVETSSSPNKP